MQIGSGQKAEPNLRLRTLLAASADRLDLARLSWNGVISAGTAQTPNYHGGYAGFVRRPARFCRPAAKAQAALIALVLEALGAANAEAQKARAFWICLPDAALSPFRLRPMRACMLSRETRAMTEAIRQAANRTQGLKQIEGEPSRFTARPAVRR